MRASTILLTAAVFALAAPHAGADYAELKEHRGPAVLTAAQWDEGTFLSWSPDNYPGAAYVLYRGSSPDSMQRIAKLATTSYYDSYGNAGGVLFYGVSVLRDGVESEPTILRADSRAACLTVSMGGSVAVRPANCMPFL